MNNLTTGDKVKLTKETLQMLIDKLEAQDKRIKHLESQIIKLQNTAFIMGHY